MAIQLLKVYINDHPGLTFTYFTTLKFGPLCFRIEKIVRLSLKGEKKTFQEITKLTDIWHYFYKQIWLKGLYAPAPGLFSCKLALFSKIFFSKPLGWSKSLYGAFFRRGDIDLKYGLGHMTKMADMPISGRNFSTPSSKLTALWSITWHAALELNLFKVCINDDPELKARSHAFLDGNLIQGLLKGKTCIKWLTW